MYMHIYSMGFLCMDVSHQYAAMAIANKHWQQRRKLGGDSEGSEFLTVPSNSNSNSNSLSYRWHDCGAANTGASSAGFTRTLLDATVTSVESQYCESIERAVSVLPWLGIVVMSVCLATTLFDLLSCQSEYTRTVLARESESGKDI